MSFSAAVVLLLVGCGRQPIEVEEPSLAVHASSAPPTQRAGAAGPSGGLSPAPEPRQIEEHSIPLPPAVQILSPAYQEAYRLLPQGPWARQYFADSFNDFDEEQWSSMAPNQPAIGVTSAERPLEWEEEWLLTRMVQDGDAEEWLLMRLRGLGEEAARVLDASEDRLEGLLKLVETGWKNQVVEIGREWQFRFILKDSEEDIARFLAIRRTTREKMDAKMQLGPKELIVLVNELRVCTSLMDIVVGGQHPWWDVVSEGQCDVDKAARLAREALEANDGQAAVGEDFFRGAVEAREAREVPEGLSSRSRSD